MPERSAEDRILAALGYLPLMFVLPLAIHSDDEFCRHHAYQGVVLLVALLIAWTAIQLFDLLVGRFLGGVFIVGFLFRGLGWLVRNFVGLIVSVAYLVLVVMGMIRACAGLDSDIPIVRHLLARLRACLVSMALVSQTTGRNDGRNEEHHG